VGPRGSHISGGQRARVALSRSLYSVLCGSAKGGVLLDDPVAALDGELVTKVCACVAYIFISTSK
jgi:ABC-type polar amino acid transport system ATPase subunit